MLAPLGGIRTFEVSDALQVAMNGQSKEEEREARDQHRNAVQRDRERVNLLGHTKWRTEVTKGRTENLGLPKR